jgi:hypothetical protein
MLVVSCRLMTRTLPCGLAELIYTSEDLRNLREEWHRFWFLDMPDHQTPYRTHGGII